MKIVILAAMEKEIQLIASMLDNLQHCSELHDFSKGVINDHEVYIGKCGIGKVNSALTTANVIDAIKPDLIINSGVAGGAGLPVGSVLMADKVAYHDVWCGPGTEYGAADGCPLYFTPSTDILSIAQQLFNTGELCYGLICTGDKFISRAEEIRFIRSHFHDVRAVDMESAAIAQTCMLSGVPFNIIRVVSDTPGEGENLSQYQNFWIKAPEKSFSVVRAIIENI